MQIPLNSSFIFLSSVIWASLRHLNWHMAVFVVFFYDWFLCGYSTHYWRAYGTTENIYLSSRKQMILCVHPGWLSGCFNFKTNVSLSCSSPELLVTLQCCIPHLELLTADCPLYLCLLLLIPQVKQFRIIFVPFPSSIHIEFVHRWLIGTSLNSKMHTGPIHSSKTIFPRWPTWLTRSALHYLDLTDLCNYLLVNVFIITALDYQHLGC